MGGIGMPSAWYGSLPGNPIPHDAYTRPQGGGRRMFRRSCIRVVFRA